MDELISSMTDRLHWSVFLQLIPELDIAAFITIMVQCTHLEVVIPFVFVFEHVFELLYYVQARHYTGIGRYFGSLWMGGSIAVKMAFKTFT